MNNFRFPFAAALLLIHAAVFAATDSKSLPARTEPAAQPAAGTIIPNCPGCPEMIVVPAGSFDMGSNARNAQPVHRVTISKPFALGKTEVTQAQWQAVMGSNPSHFPGCGKNCPVEQVSWDDAIEFIRKLNAKTGKQYRLPSEAEWEYACHAGGNQKFCGSDNLDSVAWYGTFTDGETPHPVATRQANAFGLYDMSGNVWEWVEDNYHDNYNGAPADGSAWTGTDTMHVLRGGSWSDRPRSERATSRVMSAAANRIKICGFRVAMSLP